MGAKDFFKNQTGLKPDMKGVVKDNLDDYLADVESSAHTEEKLEEKNYLLPDIDYSDPANFVKYGLAYEYYNNAFIRIRTQFPYDGSAAEKLAFYNDLTPLEKYVFDQKYPKYNGFVTLGLGTYGGATPAGFGTTTNPQYIRFYGGPHEGNVINPNVNQENNLHINLLEGYTVEFWLKKDAAADTATQTEYESLLNIRNEEDTQRFFLYINSVVAGGQSRIYYKQENYNGAAYDTINTGYFDLGTNSITSNLWQHYAFSFISASAGIKSVCYFNGQEIDTNFYSIGGGITPVYSITGSVVGTINGAGGSAGAINPGAVNTQVGYGKAVSASYDEFRIWKTERTGKQIGLNWFRNVDGGTNTDSSKFYYKTSIDNKPIDLAVYFKFNEGIISDTGAGTYDPGNEATSSTAIGDNLVLDYSGRINNGIFIGYTASLGMRSEDSAIVLSETANFEEKDPLLFIENSDYSDALTPLLESGSAHDVSNITALYNNIPQWIRDDDVKNGSEIKKLLQIIGSYFDTIHAQIEHLREFREAKYINSENKTTDYISSLLKAHGFNAPELFVDPDVLAGIFDQDEKRVFEEKLYNLKNKIYKNIYTNLVEIYKSKGTEKGFRNLFRCYGTDDELFKINLYADGVEYQIDDKTYDSLVKKRLVDFSGLRGSNDRDASVYQSSDGVEGYGYYPSSSNVNIPMTIEAQILFPNKPDIPSLQSLELLSTASLFGVHSSSLNHFLPTVPANDCDFQVQTRRDSEGFAKFVLTSSTGFFPTLSSSYFYDEEKRIYDDIPWNLAVRIYPQQYPFSNYVTESQQYVLNFYGVKNYLGTVLAEFDVSQSISRNLAGQFLTGSNKRFYIGADKQNFDGTVNYQSDVKFARFLVWNSYLTNDEITKHARNPKNYGLKNPYQNAFTFESSTITSSFITKGDTLALNWEFDNTINYNDPIYDSTSGSTLEVNKYPIHNFGTYNGRNYPGVTDLFEDTENSTILELMQANIIQRPDALYGKNMVEIKDNDYESFKFNKKPVKMFFAFEASQNEIISRDMLNFFSDVVSFNNLYGEPVHEFRDKYKEMDHFKRFYFSKVDSVSDLDKFVNLYKFLDNALDSVIGNLVPASAATSEKIRTIIEDHTLDRHKIKKPYPLLIQDFPEQLDKTKEVAGVNTKAYSLTTSDLDNGNVDVDQIYFLEDDRRTPLTSGTTIKSPIRSRDAGSGLGITGRERTNVHLFRTVERTRVGASPSSTPKRYVFSNLIQEKDRGDLLVGNRPVDTFRTQLDVYTKINSAQQSSVNYVVTSDTNLVYGQEEKGSINIVSNTFSDPSKDGYKLTFNDFSIKDEFIQDISDKAVYGPREMTFILERRNDGVKFTNLDAIPKELRVLSSSVDLYGLSPEKNFEIEYVKHDSMAASVGNKSTGKDLFTQPGDRKELFSLSLYVFSFGDPAEIYLTSPQVTVDSFGVANFTTDKPTNLVREIKRSYIFGQKENYNWDGKSASTIGLGPSDGDVRTLINDPTEIQYSITPSSITTAGSQVYDRVALSRSVDENDNAFYFIVDRGIFRDRTDIETEQLSPNASVNYKNLMTRRSLVDAYSTPSTFNGSFYRNTGENIGKSIHTALPNAHLEIDPVNTQSFVQNYDNGYLVRSSQNNYDQRWFRSSNMVRLSETNNAPYINRNFYSSYSSIIGSLINYVPLRNMRYSIDEQQTIPHDEEIVATTTFGNTYVDFSGLNTVTNRVIDVEAREINPTTNNYINPRVAASISNSKRLHYYLINSNGPYSYSLERNRLNYARNILNSEDYRNSYSFIETQDFQEDSAVKFETTPVSSKSRLNYAIIQDSKGLRKIKYDLFYPSIVEYFDEEDYNFKKLPSRLRKPILESEHNYIYNTIFSNESKQLNGFTLKYFDFAEQVFPRAQKLIKLLTNYETETNYLNNLSNRKVSQETNSLGKSFSGTAVFKSYLANQNFTSWSTENFAITDNGATVEMNDGELMQLNYTIAYTTFTSFVTAPYAEQFYNQTFGYRINHKNRNDSSVPKENQTPYKLYEKMLYSTDTQSRGIIAEYCSKNNINSYFENGCTELSSNPSLFGYNYGTDSKKLLGLASYSDEVFTLKDIHKQIDKF